MSVLPEPPFAHERHAEDDELTYAAAGVDIEAGEEAVRLIKEDVESTYIPGVLGSLGGFAGCIEMPKGLDEPGARHAPPTAWAPSSCWRRKWASSTPWASTWWPCR